ncbi:uncharacterized protein LOC126601806 [Malus sylvestris]|uniref:uncharacterized protein LOC126601806 n=1 Tax=Malus sylvestris TaxID=3752 RepID=UPI0021ABF469|nr:uncharacterized protein LOC126601806 [Malus sylvestris]XP_050124525.1 uncharacterized protein LOC126601806 [Malus sylvestris]
MAGIVDNALLFGKKHVWSSIHHLNVKEEVSLSHGLSCRVHIDFMLLFKIGPYLAESWGSSKSKRRGVKLCFRTILGKYCLLSCQKMVTQSLKGAALDCLSRMLRRS